jgi:hypothetical protein
LIPPFVNAPPDILKIRLEFVKSVIHNVKNVWNRKITVLFVLRIHSELIPPFVNAPPDILKIRLEFVKSVIHNVKNVWKRKITVLFVL